MVKKTLAGLQEDLYEDASALFAVAETLDHVDLMNLDLEDDDDTDELAQMLARGQSDTAAILRMYGALFVEEAESLKGDGMRGPYFQVQKSEDWFVWALNMPDRQFCAILRCVLTRILRGLTHIVH
jgi:hypothetical protein